MEFDVPTANDLINSDVVPNPDWRKDAATNATVQWKFAITSTWNEAHNASVRANDANLKADRILALLQTLTGRDMTNEAEIVSGVLRGLSPETIANAVAAALPVEMANQVVAALAEQLANSGNTTTTTTTTGP